MSLTTIGHKQDLENILSSAQMGELAGDLSLAGHWGSFTCQPRRQEGFSYNLRKYETGGESLTIPIASASPVITMIFQFNGTSFYNDKYSPFTLPYSHHSFNFFNSFACQSLVREKTQLHDMTFVLDKNFYEQMLVSSSLSGSHLTEKIMSGREFNTISTGLPMDAGIRDVLNNILACPFHDGFRDAYITAQMRALFILQFCQFHYGITEKPLEVDKRLTQRDREIIHEVRTFLDAFYMDDTTLGKLSRAFGINEFKLKHGFRMLFKSSPIRYVLERRMGLASELLRNTEQSINDISRTIGFQHSNNFSIAFRKRYGVTPKAYRFGR